METKTKKQTFNLSRFYVLPMINGVFYKDRNGKVTTQFGDSLIETYVQNIDFPERLQTVYVLTDDSVQPNIVTEKQAFVSSYSPAPEYQMFLYGIPESYKEDFDKFIAGKYSKFSERYKEELRKWYPSARLAGHTPVLQPDGSVKQMERYERFVNRAIFDPDNDDFKKLADKLAVPIEEIIKIGEIWDPPMMTQYNEKGEKNRLCETFYPEFLTSSIT